MSVAMPSENVQRQFMYDLYRKQFVHVLFIQTHGLDSEAFTVYRSSETDVVVYFLVFSLFSVP
jgi:hypothetical protein